MFDYVKNRYNLSPTMVKKSDINKKNLYVKYLNAPYMILPNTIESFLSSHKSKFWYNLNRFERLYKKEIGEIYFEIIKEGDSLDEFLEKAFELFNNRWRGEYISTSWKCKKGFSKYKDAMINLASENNSLLAVLYDSKRNLLSYAYCLIEDETIYFYQYTTNPNEKFKKYSLGKILLHNLLKYLINESRYKKFDFMIGEHSYKKEWAKENEEIFIEIKGKSIMSYLKFYLLRIKIFLQFHPIFRDKIKKIFLMKEKIFGKC